MLPDLSPLLLPVYLTSLICISCLFLDNTNVDWERGNLLDMLLWQNYSNYVELLCIKNQNQILVWIQTEINLWLLTSVYLITQMVLLFSFSADLFFFVSLWWLCLPKPLISVRKLRFTYGTVDTIRYITHGLVDLIP